MIDRSTVFRQVRHDLFGRKDAQDASTLTYTWVADQFGHVILGFIATLFLWPVLPIELSAIVVVIAILIKEAYEYFYEFDRRQAAFPSIGMMYCSIAQLSASTLGIGAALAVIAVHFPPWSLLAAAVVLIVLSLPLADYGLRRKIASQQSDVPFLYRLANFPENFDGPDGPSIITSLVVQPAPEFRHVVLTGPLNCGKTSLAVGTVTEFGYRAGLCRFISLVKLARTRFLPRQGMTERAGLHAGTAFQDGRTVWPLSAAELLVVDDSDGGIPELEIDPRAIREALIAKLGSDSFR